MLISPPRQRWWAVSSTFLAGGSISCRYCSTATLLCFELLGGVQHVAHHHPLGAGTWIPDWWILIFARVTLPWFRL